MYRSSRSPRPQSVAVHPVRIARFRVARLFVQGFGGPSALTFIGSGTSPHRIFQGPGPGKARVPYWEAGCMRPG